MTNYPKNKLGPLRCGDIGEDGRIFWRYWVSRSGKLNANWLSPTRFKKRKEKHRKDSKDYARRTKHTPRKREIFLRRSGLTVEKHEAMLSTQGGKCAICKGATKYVRRLAIDHCHKTGKIRGLLCGNCNAGIGYFADDISRIAAAIEYLKKNQK